MLHRALKIVRIFHDLSQKELSSLLNISRSHISEIESGKNRPSYDLLEKYSEVFEVPVSNLIFFSEHVENIDDVEISKFKNFVATKILDVMEFCVDKTKTTA